eukprot:CFRG6417T1
MSVATPAEEVRHLNKNRPREKEILEVPKQASFFKYAPLDHALSGLGAGFTTTALLHPLDLIKTRLQVQDSPMAIAERGRYRNTFHAAYKIIKMEGALGLYQGLMPNLIGNALAWGSYFMGYNAAKTKLQELTDRKQLHPLHHMLAASIAGVGTQCVTNPVWVIKARMCYQVPGAPDAYTGFANALASIWKTEGVRGLYKGFVPGLFGVSHGAVQFMAYEELKQLVLIYSPREEETHTAVETMGMALASKLTASITTYPYQVLRSRLQIQRESNKAYTGVVDCVQKIWGSEGSRGFYRGLGPNLIRVAPATMITFVVYEKLSQALKEGAATRGLHMA